MTVTVTPILTATVTVNCDIIGTVTVTVTPILTATTPCCKCRKPHNELVDII